VFRDYPTFSRICIFFLLTLLSSNLSLLSASSLLCFSSVHIVGSWTSKLPSMIYVIYVMCDFSLAQRQAHLHPALRYGVVAVVARGT